MIIKTDKISKLENNKEVKYTFIYYKCFEDIKEFLDSDFRYIYVRNDDYEIEALKTMYRNFLNSKKSDKRKIIGSIAELLIHLFLHEEGYVQECLFKNLEENSMKKGFDGLYSFAGEEFYMESKSTSKNAKHSDEICIAMADLRKKFNPSEEAEKTQNNMWDNAYWHAKAADSGNKTLIRKLVQLSQDFLYKKSIDQSKFNLIPSSTIFYGVEFSEQDVIDNLNKRLTKFEFNKLRVLCITNTIINDILAYFGVTLDEQ